MARSHLDICREREREREARDQVDQKQFQGLGGFQNRFMELKNVSHFSRYAAEFWG